MYINDSAWQLYQLGTIHIKNWRLNSSVISLLRSQSPGVRNFQTDFSSVLCAETRNFHWTIYVLKMGSHQQQIMDLLLGVLLAAVQWVQGKTFSRFHQVSFSFASICVGMKFWRKSGINTSHPFSSKKNIQAEREFQIPLSFLSSFFEISFGIILPLIDYLLGQMVYTNSHLPAHLMTTYHLHSPIFLPTERRQIRNYRHASGSQWSRLFCRSVLSRQPEFSAVESLCNPCGQHMLCQKLIIYWRLLSVMP